MPKDMFCSTCGVTHAMALVRSPEMVRMNGREVMFESESYLCPVCGERFEDGDLVDLNLNAAREAYDRLYASPRVEELVALRARYDISQKSLSALLGFGEVTINSYESGASVPHPPNRLLLKLTENPQVFREIYRLNKDKLSALQRRKIEASAGWTEAKATYSVTISRASGLASTISGVSNWKGNYGTEGVPISISEGVAG